MAEITQKSPNLPTVWRRIDKAWLAVVVIPLVVLALDAANFLPVVTFAAGAMAHTGVFIVIAISLVAYVKASGAETLLAKALKAIRFGWWFWPRCWEAFRRSVPVKSFRLSRLYWRLVRLCQRSWRFGCRPP